MWISNWKVLHSHRILFEFYAISYLVPKFVRDSFILFYFTLWISFFMSSCVHTHGEKYFEHLRLISLWICYVKNSCVMGWKWIINMYDCLLLRMWWKIFGTCYQNWKLEWEWKFAKISIFFLVKNSSIKAAKYTSNYNKILIFCTAEIT